MTVRRLNCYIKGHQGGSRCPDCLQTASNPYPPGATARYTAKVIADFFTDNNWHIGESALAHIEGIISGALRERDMETIDRCYAEVHKYIDSDEFYDILPGDGEDDYICGNLFRELHHRLEMLRGSRIERGTR